MAKLKAYFGLLIVAMFAIGCVRSTCVFESDFGFKLNCAFKKSGLFRVRNLGGVKAHLGLGFSVGDELGFDQSLTNLDTSKRRSVSVVNGAPVNNVGVTTQQQKLRLNVRNNNNRITVRQPTSAPGTTIEMPITEKMVESGRAHGFNTRQNLATLPPFRPIPPAKDMMVPKAPTGSNVQSNPNRMGQTANANYVSISASPVKIVGTGQQKNEAFRQIPAPMMQSYSPGSISRVASIEDYQNKNGGVSVVTSQAYKNSVQVPLAPHMMTKVPMGNTLSLYKQTPGPIYNSGQKIDNMVAYNVINGQNYNEYSTQSSLHQKIAALSKATNISVETIEAAVRLRQNQILQQMLNVQPSTTTTTTTTTPKPFLPTIPPKRYHPPPPASLNPASKVMNAPKEYYPVGYDKNFDDNFVSKVDLPDTTFYCGDQKHFPGLYADEDLGCMVFHVCALTDDGLIMKSFLCPESTLFDQTILKCNWWFYVDCKNSKKLYDSNIPISKSYQLMKALTFFSSYKKEVQGDDQNTSGTRSVIEENTNGVNNAVKILQNQGAMQLPKVEIVEVNKTNYAKFDRNSKFFTPIDIKEVNAMSDESTSYVTPAPINNKDRINRGRKVIDKEAVTPKSVQRQYRRRPSVSWKIASNTTEAPNEDTIHRSERSSGEVTEAPKPIETTTIKATTTTPITTPITTTKYSTMAPRTFIMPEIKEDPKVSKTIEMMDQAIMGQRNL